MALQIKVGALETIKGRRISDVTLLSISVILVLTAGLGSAMGWAVYLRYRAGQERADAAQQRLQRFYEALSDINQLIVRRPTPGAVFEGLCNVCVKTGGAAVAMVLQREDHELHVAATACWLTAWRPACVH